MPFIGVNFVRHIDFGKKTKKGNGYLDSIEEIPSNKPLALFVKVIQAFDLKAKSFFAAALLAIALLMTVKNRSAAAQATTI